MNSICFYKYEEFNKFWKEKLIKRFIGYFGLKYNLKGEVVYLDMDEITIAEKIQKYYDKLVEIEGIEDLIKSIRTDYIKSGLNKEEYNDIEVDDSISGYINNDNFMEMSDVYVTKYINHERKKKKIFKGSFVSIEYKNKYADNFKIIDKTEIEDQEIIDKDIIGQDIMVENKNKFDNFFSVEFEIYKEPSKLLTEDVKQFVADFREKYKIRFDISVKENKIYIRFFTGDMWKASLLKEPIDKISIYKYYVITKFAEELVEKLNNM